MDDAHEGVEETSDGVGEANPQLVEGQQFVNCSGGSNRWISSVMQITVMLHNYMEYKSGA